MRSHQNTNNRNYPRLCVYYENFIIRAPALHLIKHSSFIARGCVFINLTFGKIEFMPVKSGHSLAKRWEKKKMDLPDIPKVNGSEYFTILEGPGQIRPKIV